MQQRLRNIGTYSNPRVPVRGLHWHDTVQNRRSGTTMYYNQNYETIDVLTLHGCSVLMLRS